MGVKFQNATSLKDRGKCPGAGGILAIKLPIKY